MGQIWEAATHDGGTAVPLCYFRVWKAVTGDLNEMTLRTENREKWHLGGAREAGNGSTAAIIAGVLAGVAGLLTFLVIHALWITPIWFILPMGLMVAVLGGCAVGWAYAELHPRLPRRPWTVVAIMALITATLLPGIMLGEVRRPMFSISPAGVASLEMAIPEVVLRFVGELLLTAALTGALLGWWLGRTRRAAASTALAGFIFALGPGHNIPLIGGTGGTGKAVVIMMSIIGTASLVLVETHARLAGAKTVETAGSDDAPFKASTRR